jgi:hypothetical protein
MGDSNGFTFPGFNPESVTISPHALQNPDASMPPLQSGFQSTNLPRGFSQNTSFSNSWEGNGSRQSQQPSTVNPAGLLRQSEFTRSDAAPFEPSRSAIAQAPSTRTVNVQQSQAPDPAKASTMRNPKPDNASSTLRVTHPEFLSDVESLPSDMQKLAPFLIREAKPADLETIGKGAYLIAAHISSKFECVTNMIGLQ